VNSFQEIDYDRAAKIFVQESFNLPQSFPMSISRLFLGIQELISQSFTARTNFVRRLLRGSNSDASLSAMAMDREFLMERDLGWNAAFIRQVEEMLDLRAVDLTNASEVAAANFELGRAVSDRRQSRFRDSGSAFLINLIPNLVMPSTFIAHLAELPHESVRIVLIFFSNQFHYTYFRSSNVNCPFCSQNLSSTHFFDCQGIIPNPVLCWSAFVIDFQDENFLNAMDRLFLALQRWTTITNRFQHGFQSHLDEYFSVTEFQRRRQNSNWTLASTAPRSV
jgi:hypothetical protein